MMLYIAISLTLLALVAGVHLLSKAESMGKLSKWIAYVVIVVGAGMLICQLYSACMRMMHCGNRMEVEKHMMMKGDGHCGPGMRGGMMGHCGGQSMDCCKEGGMMDCCKEGGMDCCKEGMGHGMMKGHGCDMEEGEEEMAADSTKK